MEVPVYLFTGFLESGKTRFLQESLENESFNDGERVLVLICEEGSEELVPERFSSANVFIENIESPEELSKNKLKALTAMYSAASIIIEYNGMWELSHLIENTPDEWVLYQNMCFADSRTFLTYNANMRNLVADKMKLCDTMVFNRFDDSMDKTAFHQIVRTFNRRTDILYEYENGNVVPDDIQDPLPYDMDCDEIVVDDDDYAIWYRDVNEETPSYEGKTVKVKGRILSGGGMPKNCFAFGRHVMTCCIEDIEFCGVVCRMSGIDEDSAAAIIGTFKQGAWIHITAKIKNEEHPTYKGEMGPVLEVSDIDETDEPEEEVAVFY